MLAGSRVQQLNLFRIHGQTTRHMLQLTFENYEIIKKPLEILTKLGQICYEPFKSKPYLVIPNGSKISLLIVSSQDEPVNLSIR